MTIAELRNSLSGPSEEYLRKQVHAVPQAPVVVRETFILERVKGKVVLDIGASGKMHEAIVKAAKRTFGVERPPPGFSDICNFDALDRITKGENDVIWRKDLNGPTLSLPCTKVDVVVCGEVIEHLSNPGIFLDALRLAQRGTPVIITVPNAFSDAGAHWLGKGSECVNLEHVAYYSYYTLRELVTRHGYEVKEHYWYNGRPKFSEGLIFVVE